MAPLFLSPLGPAVKIDFSAFLAGLTGTRKSEVAAILQGHFGSEFSGKNLPANWTSTENSLEKQCFLAKDVLTVVDDFNPIGSQYDVNAYHKKADRLLRGQGNQAGRQRMRADGSLRPTYFPRGLILGTGEDIPRGQSLRARVMVLEVQPGDVDLEVLKRGNTISIGQKTLQKRMANKGVIAGSDPGTNTKRLTLGGVRRRVVHISPETLYQNIGKQRNELKGFGRILPQSNEWH